MNIKATLEKIEYEPLLCSELETVPFSTIYYGFDNYSKFLVEIDAKNYMALSWWVSPKRTRSYPYARVYDTLKFTGKKVTVIPAYKDEGFDGDRDYLQWDTISLMSLLGIYVIIGYYERAERNPRYDNKITNQKFNIDYINEKIIELRNFQSDALHWNLCQTQNIGEVGNMAINAYRRISDITSVRMHSFNSVITRFNEISKSAETFKSLSRAHALAAQSRELATTQPKELVNQRDKSCLTITNYLGGEYYLTADEAWINNDVIYLAECKHSGRDLIPSISDIKDGLIKMVLFSNLNCVEVENVKYSHKSILKLTSSLPQNIRELNRRPIIDTLIREAEINNFLVQFNNGNS